MVTAMLLVPAAEPHATEEQAKSLPVPEQTVEWGDLNGRIAVKGRIAVLGSVVTIRCRIRPAKVDGVRKDRGPDGFLEVMTVDGVALPSPVEYSSYAARAIGDAHELDWRKAGEWELRGFESGAFGGVPRAAQSPRIQSSGATFEFHTHLVYVDSRKID